MRPRVPSYRRMSGIAWIGITPALPLASRSAPESQANAPCPARAVFGSWTKTSTHSGASSKRCLLALHGAVHRARWLSVYRAGSTPHCGTHQARRLLHSVRRESARGIRFQPDFSAECFPQEHARRRPDGRLGILQIPALRFSAVRVARSGTP
jgi:hypothetical protein